MWLWAAFNSRNSLSTRLTLTKWHKCSFLICRKTITWGRCLTTRRCSVKYSSKNEKGQAYPAYQILLLIKELLRTLSLRTLKLLKKRNREFIEDTKNCLLLPVLMHDQFLFINANDINISHWLGQVKNLSKPVENILMNFWSERYLTCAVLPTIESKLLNYECITCLKCWRRRSSSRYIGIWLHLLSYLPFTGSR